MKYIYYPILLCLVCTGCQKSSQVLTFQYATYHIKPNDGNYEPAYNITTIFKVLHDGSYEWYRRDSKSGIEEVFTGNELPYLLQQSIDELRRKMAAAKKKCNRSHDLKSATGQWYYIDIEERGEPLSAVCFCDYAIPKETLTFIHSFEKVKPDLKENKTYFMASSVYSRIRQSHDPAGK